MNDDNLQSEIDDPRDWSKPSLAVIAFDGKVGIVVWHVGAHVETQIEQIGAHMIEDLGFESDPPAAGIWVWKGKLSGGRRYSTADGYDYEDTFLTGEYRVPNPIEWSEIQQGRCPWDASAWLLPHTPRCCALDCGRPLKAPELPFCEKHMEDENLLKAWEEL